MFDNMNLGPALLPDIMSHNIAGNDLTVETDEDFPGIFSGGTLSEDQSTMSCDYVTNPANTDGVNLLDTSEYPNCNFI